MPPKLTNLTMAALIALPVTAAPAFAAVPAPKAFVAKAGTSDLFERRAATIMATSPNPAITGFAKQMIKDHTDSTRMVKEAAKADGLTPAEPVLDAKQKAEIARLDAARGAERDKLYVTQQKAAHAEALTLMKDYAASGSATHLKATAGKIVPVVEGHIAMLDKM